MDQWSSTSNSQAMQRLGTLTTAVVACGWALSAAAHTPPSLLVVVENNRAPWPAGSGEQPPPIGGAVVVEVESGQRRRIADGLVDPVWVTVDASTRTAYIGLFHPGQIVSVPLDTHLHTSDVNINKSLHEPSPSLVSSGDSVATVARGLSCPEGVGVDAAGALYVVENPVGNECRGNNLTKSAHLTRVDIRTGAITRLIELESPHGLAVRGETAYVCEWGAHALTAVNLSTGVKRSVAPLFSPSGCAVGNGVAFAVEQGDTTGQLVQVDLATGAVTVLLDNLVGPMGVAADPAAGRVYVGQRHKNEVLGVDLATNRTSVVSHSDTVPFNSPIGLACV